MPDSAERPLSVVLLGYGLGGRVFHGPLVTAAPGLSLDAVVTSDPARSAQAAATYPHARIYGSSDHAWTGGHDVAVISTGNAGHVPLATAALEAGLHVVLDKPIAPTADAARQLAALAEARERLLVPFQNRRWDSDFRTACRVAADGRLGTVHRFESRIVKMRVALKPGFRGSAAPEDMGGMLYDLGVHVIDQALQLMGPVATVGAWLRSVRPGDPTDDDTTVVLTHVSGALSVLTVGQAQSFPEPRMTLLGTRGGLRIDSSDSQEPVLAAGGDPTASDWGVRPPDTHGLLRTFDDADQPTDVRLPLERGAWPVFYAQTAEAIRGRAAVPVRVADAIQTARVIDAAQVSATTGVIVRLDPPAAHTAR